MAASEARVRTSLASRHLQALCKHYRHKINVAFDAAAGRADFPFGTCRLTATDSELVMGCEADDAATLLQMQDIVQIHLERFAWREKPQVRWTSPPPV